MKNRYLLTLAFVLTASASVLAQSYCVPPKYSSGPFTAISMVKLGWMENFSSTNDGYKNFSNEMSMTVVPGTENTITVRIYYTPGMISSFSGKVNLSVWIDWNQDKDFFDDGETCVSEVIDCTEYPQGTEGTFTFTVPQDAKIGTTRMRVYEDMLPQDGHQEPTPCGYSSGIGQHGEVEDYGIEVALTNSLDQAAGLGSFHVYPQPATDVIVLESDRDVAVEFTTISGQRIDNFNLNSNSTRKIDTGALPAGIYLLKIQENENQYFKQVLIR